jgi:CheY-like chemotaxis protein
MIKLVLADSNQITQALLNVCLNSRDAMPQGGGLTLATERIDSDTIQKRYPEASGPYVCIAVSDEGSGMEESVRARALEPFFSTKPVGEGTGLGLAMVYGIVRNHNGFIDIESKLGVGTTVRLYLPAALEQEVSLRASVTSDVTVSAENLAQHSTVLVVEDETNLLTLLTDGLSRVGFRVLVAKDGLEAVELYQRHRNEIDLVLMDLGLPKLSGLDAVKRLKQVNSDIKIIVSTGYLEPELKTELMAAGVKDYIQKPYVVTDILRTISRNLAAPDSSGEETIH